MPDLSQQIGVLYKVIGQLEPASDASGEIRRSAASGRASRPGSRLWIRACYCLWFSTPLTAWLIGGQLGLFLYWHTLSLTAWLAEKLTPRQPLNRAAVVAGKMAADFCPLEGVTQ
ncbi:MAG TPA: hypothetical protein VHX20_18055 [Terracidiphilus sp.]|jgi:hypothetical protein|nr:hypothetical protein [Terracidiphilus sp.]